MRPTRPWILAVAVFLAALLAGCGSGTTKTYANKDFQFSVSYDAAKLTQSVDAANSGAMTFNAPGKPPVPANVILVDVTAKPAKDSYTAWQGPGGVQVSAAKTARPISPPTLAEVRQESKKDFLGMPGLTLKSAQGRLKGLAVGQWQPFTLDGLHGYTISYTTNTTHQVVYDLYNGRYHYGFVVGASKSAWSGIAPTLNAVVQSFHVTQ